MRIIERYRDEIRENKPIIYSGLELYPLTVRDFALYQNAKPAYELMQSSLPWQLARLSWIDCLWEMDVQSATESGVPAGFLSAALSVLATSLRLPATRSNNGGLVFPIRALPNKDGRLQGVLIADPTKAQPVLISVPQMDEIRAIIAAQNDYEIPDENWNPDLIKAARYTESQGKANLKLDFETLIYSVAVNFGCRAGEIWSWTIREFQMVQKAIDRKLNYQIYTTASSSGFVTFKNGNPFPSWRYDVDNTMPGSFQNIEELDAGANGLLADTTKQ